MLNDVAYCRAGRRFMVAAQERGHWGQSVTIVVRVGLAAALVVAASIAPVTSQAAQAASLPIASCKPMVQAQSPSGGDHLVQINFLPKEYRLRSTGSIQITTIFIDFPDARSSISPSTYYETHISPGLRFLEAFSQGRLKVEDSQSTEWIRMPKPSSAYEYSRQMSSKSHRDFIQEAVKASDPSIDFARTDALVVVMPPDLKEPGYEVSPAFLGLPDFAIAADGNTIVNATTIGTDWPFHRPFVVAHELLHTMGLVDLYDFNGTWDGTPYVQRFVGPYSLMGHYSTNPELLGWERWVLGWLEDDQAVCLAAGTHEVSLDSIARKDSSDRLAVIPLEGSRFVVLEARTKAGLDSAGSEGVLPYVVDPSIPTGSGPIRVPSTSPRSLIRTLVPGQSAVIEGMGIEVLERRGDSFRVRVHTSLPEQTPPSGVHLPTITRLLGTVTVAWQPPLRDGWTPITAYEYRVGSGRWIRTSDTKAFIRGAKKGQVLTVDVRALNAVGLGPVARLTLRIR